MFKTEESAKTKRHSALFDYLKFKLLLGVLVVAVIAAALLGLKSVFSTESSITKLGFEDIGELATQVAYCTEVNVTEASRELWGVKLPFTQSKYIYSYGVTVKAGIDFGAIHWSLDEKSKVIRVQMPQAKVLSCAIDPQSFKLYHEKESIFRQITLEENNEALISLEESARENAVANGLLDNASENAKEILKGFFAGAFDLEEYRLEFV